MTSQVLVPRRGGVSRDLVARRQHSMRMWPDERHRRAAVLWLAGQSPTDLEARFDRVERGLILVRRLAMVARRADAR